MSKYQSFMRTLNNSKQYEMDCYGHLTVTDYNTGETTVLNLTWLTEEMFEELVDDIASDDEEEEEF